MHYHAPTPDELNEVARYEDGLASGTAETRFSLNRDAVRGLARRGAIGVAVVITVVLAVTALIVLATLTSRFAVIAWVLGIPTLVVGGIYAVMLNGARRTSASLINDTGQSDIEVTVNHVMLHGLDPIPWSAVTAVYVTDTRTREEERDRTAPPIGRLGRGLTRFASNGRLTVTLLVRNGDALAREGTPHRVGVLKRWLPGDQHLKREAVELWGEVHIPLDRIADGATAHAIIRAFEASAQLRGIHWSQSDDPDTMLLHHKANGLEALPLEYIMAYLSGEWTPPEPDVPYLNTDGRAVQTWAAAQADQRARESRSR